MYKTWSVAFRIENRQIARHAEQGLLYTASLGSKAEFQFFAALYLSRGPGPSCIKPTLKCPLK